MCTGYRYDLLAGAKVEGLCTCACHGMETSGIRGKSHMENMIYELDRFKQAQLITHELLKNDGFTEDDYPRIGV